MLSTSTVDDMLTWLRPAYLLMEHGRWAIGLHRAMTPHRIKQLTLRTYARQHGLRTLVETGTYRGDMVWALRRDFDELYSVELDLTLCERAQRRLARCRHVHIYQGDSAHVLPDILGRLNAPALFWLDGHFSGGVSARGAETTPIRAELHHILSSAYRSNIILIDDARLFNGSDDYPSVDELFRQVNAAHRDLALAIANDVIRISPRAQT